ncbi:MAG: endo-1,4-beta-xylanase [Leadbetterella sp.]|nr:endo-1,4-beta-xylanase [Leadbetterella sp.]
MKNVTLTSLLLLSLFSCKEGGGENVPPKETPGILKEKASFGIGAAVKTSLFTDATYTTTVKKHFSQVTADVGNENGIHLVILFCLQVGRRDRIVSFAADNNLDVHGHTLVWYKSFPQWFRNAKYDSVTFESRVKEYILATASRYRGKVKSWDVVNEIFNDNGTLRSVDCPVFATFKDPIGFYGRCFRYAHEADPGALLFYNDYNVVLAANKRSAIKKMVTRFKSEGVPVHGIGDQFHYRVSTDKSAMKTGLNDMASTGLLIHISELDIVVNTAQSESYEFTTPEAVKQADTYQYIAEIFEALPAGQKFAITTWGVSDKYTWLTDYWHRKEYPLLFDQNYNEKQAYKGLLSGLK